MAKEDANPILDVHSMTGVDQLHASNLTGKGVRVAIVDGGLDYLHPALGAGFGPGYKVEYGWDFVGDDVRPICSATALLSNCPVGQAAEQGETGRGPVWGLLQPRHSYRRDTLCRRRRRQHRLQRRCTGSYC